MGFQSKTYSLSDEVVEAIEEAKAGGLSPNQFLRRVLGIDEVRRPSIFIGTPNPEEVPDWLRNDPNVKVSDSREPPQKKENAPTFRVECVHCGGKFGSENRRAVLCDACADAGHRGDRYGCEECRLLNVP